ncbi:hypothetical protein Hdeb2414_s0016g00499131 [Helianthus debilis subsp. tardiflorus]
MSRSDRSSDSRHESARGGLRMFRVSFGSSLGSDCRFFRFGSPIGFGSTPVNKSKLVKPQLRLGLGSGHAVRSDGSASVSVDSVKPSQLSQTWSTQRVDRVNSVNLFGVST